MKRKKHENQKATWEQSTIDPGVLRPVWKPCRLNCITVIRIVGTNLEYAPTDTDIKTFTDDLASVSAQYGLSLDNCTMLIEEVKKASNLDVASHRNAFNEVMTQADTDIGKAQPVVVVLPSKDKNIYYNVRNCADRSREVPALCVSLNAMKKNKGSKDQKRGPYLNLPGDVVWV